MTGDANTRIWGTGVVHAHGGDREYPVSERDIQADTHWAWGMFERMGFAADDTAVFVAGRTETAQMQPYRLAAERMGVTVLDAENEMHGGARLYAWITEYPVRIVFGLGEAVLDGLEAGGHPPQQVLENVPILVARTGAHARLRNAGFKPWQMLCLGPAFAFTAPGGGRAMIDEDEWVVVRDSTGEACISSAGQRRHAFVRFPTSLPYAQLGRF
ncbi:MAG: hypothetical protein AB7Q97_17710 [Gammaproteobacteria bacterium]